MNTSLLYNKLSALPENLKKEVVNYIDLLIAKSNQDIPSSNTVPKAKFGSGKGMFIMHEGFDDPLDDFKEYMPEH